MKVTATMQLERTGQQWVSLEGTYYRAERRSLASPGGPAGFEDVYATAEDGSDVALTDDEAAEAAALLLEQAEDEAVGE